MKSKKNILLFTTDLTSGGVKQSTLRLAKLLYAHGADVTILSYEKIQDPSIEKTYPGINFKSLNLFLVREFSPNKNRLYFETMRFVSFFVSIALLRFELRKNEYSTVFSFSYIPNIISAISNSHSRHKPRLIFSERQNPEQDLAKNRLDYIAIKRLCKYFYKNADIIHANSKDMVDVISRFYEVPDSKIAYFPNFFFQDDIVSLSEEGPEIKIPYIISAGRLTEQKGLWNSIYIFKNMRDLGYKGNLVILGSGPMKPELQALAQQYSLQDHVLFIEDKKNPFPLYKNAQLLLFPSLWESFGNVLVECLMLGTPALAADCSGPLSIMGDYNKYLFNPKCNSDFATTNHHPELDAVAVKAMQLIDEREAHSLVAKGIAHSYTSESVAPSIFSTIFQCESPSS